MDEAKAAPAVEATCLTPLIPKSRQRLRTILAPNALPYQINQLLVRGTHHHQLHQHIIIRQRERAEETMERQR